MGEELAREPRVFSFAPHCHDEWGSQKYTGMPVAMVKFVGTLEVPATCRTCGGPYPRRCGYGPTRGAV